MKSRILFICFSLFVLVACSSEKEADELMQEVEEEHDEIKSLESAYVETYSDETIAYEEVYHFDEKKGKADFINAEFTLYKEKEDYELTTPRDPESIQEDEIAIIKAEIDQREEFHMNPITFYKQFDDDFFKHVEITGEDDDTWTITYEAEDDSLQDFYKKYSEFILDAMNVYMGEFSPSEISNLDIKDFNLDFLIDKETKRIIEIEFKEHTTFIFSDSEQSLDRTLLFEYDSYNEAEEIEVPEDAFDITDGIIHHEDDESNPLEDAFDDVFGDRLEGNPEMEEQAVLYLEGLIQALVYQDVDQAVEVSEGAMDEEEADMQRSFFRDVYIENTEANMGDVNIDEEHLENLADAFLSAIGKTSYDIIATEYDGLGQVVVLLEIEGIDDFLINQQTEEDMTEVLDENEDASVDELVEKNLKILADNYEEYDELLEPIEIVVPILIEGENDFYIEPDDFLQGFVQQ